MSNKPMQTGLYTVYLGRYGPAREPALYTRTGSSTLLNNSHKTTEKLHLILNRLETKLVRSAESTEMKHFKFGNVETKIKVI